MQVFSFDIALLNWLHNHPVPYSVPVLQFISNTTTPVSILIVLIFLLIAIVRRSRTFYLRCASLVMVLLLAAGVTQGLKALIDRDRPFDTFPEIEKLSTGGDSSFPSGHTVEAFAMAAALAGMFPRRRVVLPVYLWAATVAYSRMVLGVHYPTDILAGIALGSIVGFLIPWTIRKLFR